MKPSTSLSLIAAAALGVLLTACSSSKSGSGSAVTTVPVTTSAAAPSTPAVTSVAPSSAAAPSGGAAGLTPTDSTLSLGATAKVLYELKTLSNETTTLAIAVQSIKQGSISDLKDFKLDAQTKTGVPFYVTASFKNVGAKAVDPGGIFGTISAFNEAGDEVPSINLIGDFPKCEGLPPDSLAPGKSFTECDVYIAPAGQKVASVVYEHFVGDNKTKITWK
jgi:hypothetical protein